MKRFVGFLALAGLASSLTFVGPLTAGPDFNNKYSPEPQTVECRDSDDNVVGTVTYGGPLKMWPPNHKYQTVTVTALAVDSGDDVTLGTEGTHDEYAQDGSEANGAGNTDNDVNPIADSDGPNDGSAATSHDLRSERAGTGDGRVYTLDWQATFTDDADDGYGEVVCGSADLDGSGFDPNADAFLIEVPHDMRCGADWKGGNQGNGGQGQCGSGA
ncbi:MAG TPA: hypothetical protein VGB51_05355 [Actinomycetota bacterium]